MTSEYYKNFNPFEDKDPIIETIDEAVQAGTLTDSIVEATKRDIASYVYEEENLLPHVATSVANFNSEPVLSIPFNDSGELERGFGNRNEYGNKAVDFTCNAVRYGINKSGVLQRYEPNEIIIGKDGATLSHHALVTINPDTDDLASTSIYKVGVTIDSDAIVAPLLDDFSDKIVEDTSTGEHRIAYNSITFVSGDVIAFTVFVKAAERTKGRVYYYSAFGYGKAFIFDLDAGTITDGKITKMSDGWFMLQGYHTATTSGGSGFVIYMWDGENKQTYTGDGVSGMYVYGLTLAKHSGYIPYIKAIGAAAAIPAAITSIPAMNNFPAAGQPWTVEYDLRLLNKQSVFVRLLSLSDELRISITNANSLYIHAKSSSGTAMYIGYPTLTTEKTKIIVRYASDNTVTIFFNGVKKTTGTLEETPYYSIDESSKLNIGSTSTDTTSINGYMKNIKIYHEALTDDEIYSKGAA